MSEALDPVLKEIAQAIKPVSIFLYGSYGTQEYVEDSDVELVERAYKARGEFMEDGDIEDFVFEAITYCNTVVEKRMREELEKGNRLLLT